MLFEFGWDFSIDLLTDWCIFLIFCRHVWCRGKASALGSKQWCSGSGATGAIALVPLFRGGAPLQFLFDLFLVNVACILKKLTFYLNYYWQTTIIVLCSIHFKIFFGHMCIHIYLYSSNDNITIGIGPIYSTPSA